MEPRPGTLHTGADPGVSSPAPTLRHKVADGALLLTFVRTLTRSLDLIGLVVLTRFLLPGDFGLVALAVSVIQVVEAVLELPTGQAMLQLRAVERDHLDTAFTLAVLRGLMLAALLCAASIPMAAFYHDDRLIALTCALAIAPALRAMRSPRLFEYFKALHFGPDATAETIGKVAALIASSTIAIVTRSYWAIAVATITAPLISSIASFVIAPYRPRLTLKHWDHFKSYVGWSMAGQLTSALNWQTDRFVLGRLTTQTILGLFTTTRELAGTAVKVIFDTSTRPVIAALAAVSHDAARLASAYSRVSAVVLSLGLPIAVGQALVAPEIVRLVLGPNWVPAIAAFQLVSIAMIPTLYSNLTSALFYAIGRPELVFSRNFYDFLFRIPVMGLLIWRYGWFGAVYAILAAEVFLTVICLVTVNRLLGHSVTAQLFRPWRSMISVIVMAGAVAAMRRIAPAEAGTLGAALFLLKTVPVAAMVYTGVHVLIWQIAGRPEGTESIAFEILRQKLRRMIARSA